ncbi:MAG: porin family protein [Saprospiraceae bacterium]|nr:porin family protein [Saprospiraceae bacterium]
MLKKMTLTGASLIMVFNLLAQEFNLGIKAGWNLTTVRDIPQEWNDFDIENRNGFHIGGVAEWYLTEKTAIVAELLFSGKGATITSVDSFQARRESTVKLQYVTLPLLLQVKLGPINLQAGPEFGLQIDEAVEGTRRDQGILSESFWDNDFDISGVGGLTFDIGNFFFGARYGLSLAKIGEYTKTDVNGNPDGEGSYGQNSFWQLSLGLRLL